MTDLHEIYMEKTGNPMEQAIHVSGWSAANYRATRGCFKLCGCFVCLVLFDGGDLRRRGRVDLNKLPPYIKVKINKEPGSDYVEVCTKGDTRAVSLGWNWATTRDQRYILFGMYHPDKQGHERDQVYLKIEPISEEEWTNRPILHS